MAKNDSASAVLMVARASNAPCSKITLVIDSPSSINPTVAGMVRQNAMVREETKVSFNLSKSLREAYLEITGIVAIEMATPKSPTGSQKSLKE